MKIINIPHKKISNLNFMVDDEDYDNLSKFNWHSTVIKFKNEIFKFYARRVNGNKTVSMHREILGVTDSKIFVDHKDGNTFNNQKSNLRTVTPTQNIQNGKKCRGRSKYKGVCYIKTRNKFKEYEFWMANIRVNGKLKRLGFFPYNPNGELEAAILYNTKAKEFFGEFANINQFNANAENNFIPQFKPIPLYLLPLPKNTVSVYLGKDIFSIISSADLALISSYKWYADKCNGGFYARSTNKIFMHKLIMGVGKGVIVDHINRNRLDNRRENLRIVTSSENAINRTKKKNTTSKYKGVSMVRKKWKNKNGNVKTIIRWRVEVSKNNKSIIKSSIKTEIEAAIIYNELAKKLHGELAILNKI